MRRNRKPLWAVSLIGWSAAAVIFVHLGSPVACLFGFLAVLSLRRLAN